MIERTTRHLRITYGYILAGLKSEAGPDLARTCFEKPMTREQAIEVVSRMDLDSCAPIIGCTCDECVKGKAER